MADENVIGLTAELDTKRFEAGKQRLDAMVASLDKNLGDFEKKQADNSKRVADAANRAADAQERANKKASDSAETHSKKQSQAIDRTVGKFRSAAALISIIAASIVLAYKKLGDAATEFGDTEAIAKFDAMDASIAALEDTVLAAGLEFEKTAGLVAFFTGIVTTATQAVTLLAGGFSYLAEIQRGLSELGKSTGIMSLEDLNDPAKYAKMKASTTTLEDILKKAQEAANKTIISTVTAPERSAATTRATEAEKDANKQREKTTQNILDYNSKIRDLTIKSGESILEAEKDYHAKSAEAWASYMEKVASIVADGIQKRAEIARARSEAIASAETDYQRGIENASYQHGQKLADIERDYQNTIRNIQESYQTEALDAIRNLDAIGLLRAKEKRDKDLVGARTNRDQANAAEGQNYTRQLYELQRALEDKKREAEIAYQKGLADQKRAEAEALQAEKNALAKQNAANSQALSDKMTAIQQSYNNENAAAQAQYGYSEAAFRNHLIAMQAIATQYGIGAATSTRGAGTTHRRAEGGLDVVNTPTQFLAGEAGPEMVYTVPLNRSIQMSSPQVVNHMGDFSHSIDAAISSSVAGLDGRITAVVRKALAEVLR